MISILLIIRLKTCKGLAAGANPEIGQTAAVESIYEINECLENSDVVMNIAGMGGGTGTGAAPVIAISAIVTPLMFIAINYINGFFTYLC